MSHISQNRHANIIECTCTLNTLLCTCTCMLEITDILVKMYINCYITQLKIDLVRGLPVEPALDVTDSPCIRSESTPPVAASPEEEQFNAEGNNSSQGTCRQETN